MTSVTHDWPSSAQVAQYCSGPVHSCGFCDIQRLQALSPLVSPTVDDVCVAAPENAAQICPLCSERSIGIDGICPTCWLTLAKLEEAQQNPINVSVRDVFIEL